MAARTSTDRALYLRNEGRNDIWAYGIAFFKKRCKVVAEKLK